MNIEFEVLLCDYTTVDVVELYTSNITVAGNEERETTPAFAENSAALLLMGIEINMHH
jgi:hypothetical protein